MNKRLGSFRPLALGLLVGLVGGDAQTLSNRMVVREGVCEQMSALFAVDAEIAQSKVPPDYDLLLNPDGSANLHFVTKVCSYEVEGRVAVTKEVEVLIGLQGPFQIIPVPGAPVTLPSAYFYHLFGSGEAPGWLSGALTAFGFTGLVPPGSIEIEIPPFAPVRVGHLVERRAHGEAYRWTEHATPIPFSLVLGQYGFFYHERNHARRYRSEGPQLLEYIGVGNVVLEIAPNASLADFGSVLMGTTFDYISTKRLVLVNYR